MRSQMRELRSGSWNATIQVYETTTEDETNEYGQSEPTRSLLFEKRCYVDDSEQAVRRKGASGDASYEADATVRLHDLPAPAKDYEDADVEVDWKGVAERRADVKRVTHHTTSTIFVIDWLS